jgi:hypothetical protein
MDDLTIPQQPAAPRKRIGLGKILIGLGALLSIAVGGGVGAYIVHHENQHNKQVIAQAKASVVPIPKSKPQTAGVRADGSHYGPLYPYLLPTPAGYTLGPDDGTCGDNAVLTAAQFDGDISCLIPGQPQSDLADAKSSLADVQVTNLAVRTYRNTATSLVLEIELVQSSLDGAAQNSADFASTISDPSLFSQGPAVPGYDQATCVLPPGLGSDTVDSMICVASIGDMEVRVDAYGIAPLDQPAIAQIVSRQLDLLKTNQKIG